MLISYSLWSGSVIADANRKHRKSISRLLNVGHTDYLLRANFYSAQEGNY